MLAAVSPTSETNRFLPLVESTRKVVDRRLARALAEAARRYSKEGVEVEAMLEATSSLSLRGGKRLRAALLFAGASTGQSPKVPRPVLVAAATALELLQSYFLIHDDWMDQDATRRGGPSVHAALAQRFSSSHLGACGAVLAGDFLVALATREFAACLAERTDAAALLTTFSELQLQAVVGQQLDVIGLTRDAERIYALKTSSYSVAGPLKLGAQLASADSTVTKSLVAFGEPIGLAFQLRDDLLSLFGDPATTGKPLGSDLRAGKWTYIVQAALTTDARGPIEACLGNPKASEKLIKAAIAAIRDCGAYANSLKRIEDLCRRAERVLERAPLEHAQRQLLRDAVAVLVDRDH